MNWQRRVIKLISLVLFFFFFLSFHRLCVLYVDLYSCEHGKQVFLSLDPKAYLLTHSLSVRDVVFRAVFFRVDKICLTKVCTFEIPALCFSFFRQCQTAYYALNKYISHQIQYTVGYEIDQCNIHSNTVIYYSFRNE